MNKYILACILAASLLALWTAISYYVNNSVETPSYTVLEEMDGYEIRQYEPYIAAQVEITASSYDESLEQGFRVLADYIFGNNTAQTSVDMTAPVLEAESEKIEMTAPVVVKESETIPMTAPVTEYGSDNTRTITFIMPSSYTLDTLPQPNNPDVQIVSQPERTIAALRFSWFRTADRIAAKKQTLSEFLARDDIMPTAPPEYAGYNAPLTAPWLNRNEILIPIEYAGR